MKWKIKNPTLFLSERPIILIFIKILIVLKFVDLRISFWVSTSNNCNLVKFNFKKLLGFFFFLFLFDLQQSRINIFNCLTMRWPPILANLWILLISGSDNLSVNVSLSNGQYVTSRDFRPFAYWQFVIIWSWFPSLKNYNPGFLRLIFYLRNKRDSHSALPQWWFLSFMIFFREKVTFLQCLTLCLDIDCGQGIGVKYRFLVRWLLGGGPGIIPEVTNRWKRHPETWDKAFKKHKIKCFSPFMIFLKKYLFYCYLV